MEPFYTFHIELKKLNKKLLSLSTQVEERFRQATSLITNYDEQIAQSLILSDYQIDEQEVEIEEDCLKILALHQPVAGDLRFIITVIKVNNELERIADMGVNIAIGARAISKSPSRDLVKDIDFSEMSETCAGKHPGNIQKLSGQFAGYVLDMSKKLPRNVPDMSRTCPRNLRESSRICLLASQRIDFKLLLSF